MPTYTPRLARRLPDDEIVRLYVEDGLDSETIGARAVCSPTAVLDLVRRAGHPVRPRGGVRKSPRLKLTEAEIVSRYRAGLSGPKLADLAGCGVGTIYGILRRANVTRRTGWAAAATAEAARIRRAREQG